MCQGENHNIPGAAAAAAAAVIIAAADNHAFFAHQTPPRRATRTLRSDCFTPKVPAAATSTSASFLETFALFSTFCRCFARGDPRRCCPHLPLFLRRSQSQFAFARRFSFPDMNFKVNCTRASAAAGYHEQDAERLHFLPF
jgi:hypothetical protein